MEIEEFSIDDAYLVRTSGTSDGTQDKYFKDNLWFKLDRYGGEGLAETAVSKILYASGMDSSGTDFKPAPIFDNGKSFLIGNKKAEEKLSLKEKIACAFAKSFSPSFDINARYLKKYCTLNINEDCIQAVENWCDNNIIDILKLTTGEH
ncbi:MAG: hypothetical protein IKO39_09990 [Treponema sp.]|nr:hypothetical protein [Treponema sp.]